jgi:hypothetical protein
LTRTCADCGQPLQAWTRMPTPASEPWSELDHYRVYLGNVLITHGWVTYDGITWHHPQERNERFNDRQALARELAKLRAGLRRAS